MILYTVYGDAVNPTSPYAGAVMNVLGDSITVGAQETKRYWQWLEDLLGCTCINYGISGTSIAANDYKADQAFYVRYSDMANGADVVVVMGGANDKWHGSSLGSMGDTTGETFYGALDVLCQGLRAKYPLATIVFITPAEMAGFTFEATASVEEFADAIKDVCSKYAINVFDHRRISGIYPQNATNKTYWTRDGVHLNDRAHEMLGKRLANYLLQIAGYPAYQMVTHSLKLPAEYQRVEYLQGDGASYLNLDYYFTGGDYEINTKIAPTVVEDCVFCGVRKAQSSSWCLVFGFNLTQNALPQMLVKPGTANWQFGKTAMQAYTPYNLTVTFSGTAQSLAVNSVKEITSSYAVTFSDLSTVPLYLFAVSAPYAPPSTSNCRHLRVYSFSIKKDGKIKMDLIPCYRKSDGKPGMYDRVSGAFFVNQLSGEFILGPDV